MTDIFNSNDNSDTNTPSDDQITMEYFVGEGKKYANPDVLAKSYYHSEKHIRQLEAELAEERKQKATLSSVEEAIKKLQEKGNTPLEETPPSGEPREPVKVPSGLSEEDARNLFLKMKQDEQAASNLAEVQAKIKAKTGSDEAAVKFINSKAAELGISASRLRELSQETPSAVLKLLGVDEEEKGNDTGFKTYSPKTLSSATNPDNPSTVADYEELRKKDLNKFFSPEVQIAYSSLKEKEIRDRMAGLSKTN